MLNTNFRPKTNITKSKVPMRPRIERGRVVAEVMGDGSVDKPSKYMIRDAITTGKMIYDAVPDSMKNQAARAIRDKVTDVVEDRSKGGGRKHRHSSGYALTNAPIPDAIKLDTGIYPNTYVSDYMDAKLNACAPLHMTGAIFQFPNYAATDLQNYFLNVISFDIQTKAQNNVSFNLNVATDFSSAKILTAFNSLVSALQILLYYKSIIAYYSNPHNNNQGMAYLRFGITPQLLEDLTLLERRLMDTPVPPNLLEFLRYLSGNFSSGDMAGAPIIKITPLQVSTTGVDVNAAAAALTSLSSDANNLVFSLMRRAVPHWLPGSFRDVPVTPVYDENFLTIWANLPFISYFNAVENSVPNVSNTSTSVQYNSYTNVLDGAAFSLLSLYDTTAGGWIPGLMVPSGAVVADTAHNTRISYYTDGTIKQFYPSDTVEFLRISRVETYVVNGAGTLFIAPHRAGSANCLNVNESALRETSFKTIDYLMSFDKIKVDARNYHFGNKEGRSNRNKRGK